MKIEEEKRLRGEKVSDLQEVGHIPVSRESLVKADFPLDVLDLLMETPGTWAIGFSHLQNAVSIEQGEASVALFVEHDYRVFAKTQEALESMGNDLPDVIFCGDGLFKKRVAIIKGVCVLPADFMRDREHDLSLMKVWLEYDCENETYLVGHLGTAVADFQSKTYRHPAIFDLEAMRNYIYSMDFTLSSDSYESTIRAALSIPCVQALNASEAIRDVDASAIIHRALKEKSLNDYYGITSKALFFYLNVCLNLKRKIEGKQSFRIPVERLVSEEFLLLFGKEALSMIDTKVEIMEKVDKVSVAMAESGFSTLALAPEGSRFLAHCALLPILAEAQSTEERTRILDFFAEGSDVVEEGSVSYDDIICAWQDDVIDWSLSGVLGLPIISGYADEKEDCPTNVMTKFVGTA